MGAANSTPEAPPAGSSTPSGATLGRRPENIRGLRLPPSAPASSGALVPTATQGGRRLQEVLAAHLSAAGGGAGGGAGGLPVGGAPMAELETVGVVRNAVHLQADTLRLVPVAAEQGATGAAGGGADAAPAGPRYALEFSFDATVRGAVTVFCHAREVGAPTPPVGGGGGGTAATAAGGGGGGVAARYTGTSAAGGTPVRTRFDVGLRQVYRQKAAAALDVSAGHWVVRDGAGRSGGAAEYGYLRFDDW